jgi:hypothetical protein
MYDAALSIKGHLKKKSGTGAVDLVNNNAGGFLFDSITYELNGIEIEHVKDPGIVSLVRGYLCYNENETKHLNIAGWSYPEVPSIHVEGKFYMRIPLRHFFGLFNDYKTAICGKHTIRLIRARNDDNCMLIDKDDTKGEISIDSIELKVQHITPNDALKIDLLKSIRSDQPILIPFRQWVIHELPALHDGSTKEVWGVKTTSTIDCPRYVIIAFQTKRIDNALADNTKFDHIDTSDVRLFLNGEYYPYERMSLNFEKSDFVEAYHSYSEFYPSFMGVNEKHPLLTYSAFKDRALFVIDCSRRDDTLKSSAIDVKVEIDARKGFPAKTKAYCIIVHDCIMEYLPLSEIVRKMH